MSATMVAASGWHRRVSSLGQALAVTVMATAIVTSLHLYARGPAPEPVPASKNADRLAFEVDEVSQRLTGGYDGLATFALPFVEPQPWSDALRTADAAAPVPAPSRQARAVESDHPARVDTERRVVSALPPSRPASLPTPTVVAAAATPADPAAAGPADRRMRVFGLGLPGTEYLPTPREAVGHVASLGAVIASAGEAVGDAVLPR